MSDTALKSWLQETGRDIARAVGSELKNQAKDKAVSLANEQLGLGLADELHELARDVGGELKSSAKKKAVSMAEDKLEELMPTNPVTRHALPTTVVHVQQ